MNDDRVRVEYRETGVQRSIPKTSFDPVVHRRMPADMAAPPDHDERMRVAERFAWWHLGSPSWAGAIVEAYLHPEAVAEALDREQSE